MLQSLLAHLRRSALPLSGPTQTSVLGGTLLLLAACGTGGPDASGSTVESEGTSGSEETVQSVTEAEVVPEPETTEPPSEEAASGDEETSTQEPAQDPEEQTATTEEEGEDPAMVWRQMVGRGRSVFRQACDTCHPGGEADIGPGIKGLGYSVERMTRQIRRGSGRMRPIPPARLPDRYMGDLMAYLSVLRTVRGVERPE